MIYLGVSFEDAIKSIGDFDNHEQDERNFPKRHEENYSALPLDLKRTMLKYYKNGSQWYSIVRTNFDLDYHSPDKNQYLLF